MTRPLVLPEAPIREWGCPCCGVRLWCAARAYAVLWRPKSASSVPSRSNHHALSLEVVSLGFNHAKQEAKVMIVLCWQGSSPQTPRFTTFCNRHRPLKRIFPFPKGNYTATAACARRCLAKPLQRLLAAAAVLVEQQHHHWGDMIRCAGSERPAIETESICCETCSDQPICAQCSSSSVAQQAPGGPRV